MFTSILFDDHDQFFFLKKSISDKLHRSIKFVIIGVRIFLKKNMKKNILSLNITHKVLVKLNQQQQKNNLIVITLMLVWVCVFSKQNKKKKKNPETKLFFENLPVKQRFMIDLK